MIISSTPFRQYSQLPWRFIAMMCSIQMNECESVHQSVPLAGHFSLVSHQLHATVFAHSSQSPKHPLIASAMVVLIVTSPATSSNPEIHIVWCYNDMCSLSAEWSVEQKRRLNALSILGTCLQRRRQRGRPTPHPLPLCHAYTASLLTSSPTPTHCCPLN